MLKGLDSSSVPTATQVAQAKAANYRLWSGYLQSKPNVNIYHAWTKANFDVARQCGSTPIAYCSGWDDPVACKNLAAAWGVRLCLDVESSVRADGSWVQPWLNASGAGLYGNLPVFNGRHAPFFVMSAYPGYDPGKTWSGTPPAVPHAWQWFGSHSLFGIGVDTTNFDDWFGQQPTPPHPQEETRMYIAVVQGTAAQWLVTDDLIVPIETAADSAAYQATGIKQTSPLSPAQWAVTQATYAAKAASTPTATGALTVSGTLNVT